MSVGVDTAKLSAMVRAKRGSMGLRAAAEEIGDISASTLSRIEQGRIPDLDTFFRLCTIPVGVVIALVAIIFPL